MTLPEFLEWFRANKDQFAVSRHGRIGTKIHEWPLCPLQVLTELRGGYLVVAERDYQLPIDLIMDAVDNPVPSRYEARHLRADMIAILENKDDTHQDPRRI